MSAGDGLSDRRYGARGRIGMIVPWDNAVIEPEFARMLPAGVTGNVQRLPEGPIERQVDDALELAGAAPRFGANVLLYCCVASACLRSAFDDREFCRGLSDASGVPAHSATGSMVAAAEALGARRLALLLPYPTAKCDAVEQYLEQCGLSVVADERLGLEPEQINALSPREVYDAACRVDAANADALLLVSTNLPAMETLAPLQERLGIPVFSTNAALSWSALRSLGLAAGAPDGRSLQALRRGADVAPLA